MAEDGKRREHNSTGDYEYHAVLSILYRCTEKLLLRAFLRVAEGVVGRVCLDTLFSK